MSVVTQDQICDIFKVNKLTIRQWRKEGMPFTRNQKSMGYDFMKVVYWMKENKRDYLNR